ncbi:MAG: hypothetical protein B7X41_14945, partial [Microbacterium sp. 14-71-5]
QAVSAPTASAIASRGAMRPERALARRADLLMVTSRVRLLRILVVRESRQSRRDPRLSAPIRPAHLGVVPTSARHGVR